MPQGVEHNEPGTTASVVPSLPPAGAPAPSSPPPAPTPRPSFWSRCAGPFRYAIRRPGRTAAIVGLIAVIGVVGAVSGMQVWGHFLLQAARWDVDHSHNRQAHDHLDAYLKVWPNDPAALILAARTARRLSVFPEAERFMDRCEAVRGPGDEELILERVLLQAERGQVDKVRGYCDARIEHNDPSAPLILEAQTVGLMRYYRVDEAGGRLETWLKLRPDDTQALLLRGELRSLRGGQAAAAEDFARVVELDPDNEEAHRRLGALMLDGHRPKEALPHLAYLQKVTPDDPRVLVQMAQCWEDMAETDKARRMLDDVLARWPHFPDALAARGALARQDGQMERAEALLREATAAEPGARDAQYQLYLCLSAEGKDAEAKAADARLHQLEDDLKEMQKLVDGAMQRAPDDPALRTKAGEIALRSGEEQEGVRWLESALEINPNYAPAHAALAKFYQQIGDRTRAEKHLKASQPAPAPDNSGR
ncbi:MAG TPA: tetratricopeptide repeat protein [Gemmataceae bacterium]|nr:tetratricopeptide repeat protein [Gemmataceae bacterium]